VPNLVDITGIASATLAVASLWLLVPGIKRLKHSYLAILLFTTAVIFAVPLPQLPLSGYVRGGVGDLSITSLVLLVSNLLRALKGWPNIRQTEKEVMLTLIALASLFLYPMALGFGSFDPYRLGYGDPRFLSVLFFFAITAWLFRLSLISICIGLAVLAYAIGWYESNNIWDYLLDPWVSIYALSVLSIHAARRIIRHRSKELPQRTVLSDATNHTLYED
jgi:hypothetical protein